jgi:hypothetical protein
MKGTHFATTPVNQILTGVDERAGIGVRCAAQRFTYGVARQALVFFLPIGHGPRVFHSCLELMWIPCRYFAEARPPLSGRSAARLRITPLLLEMPGRLCSGKPRGAAFYPPCIQQILTNVNFSLTRVVVKTSTSCYSQFLGGSSTLWPGCPAVCCALEREAQVLGEQH